jgi:hypothetical protein
MIRIAYIFAFFPLFYVIKIARRKSRHLRELFVDNDLAFNRVPPSECGGFYFVY